MRCDPVIISAVQCVLPCVEIMPVIGDLVRFDCDVNGQGIARVTGTVCALGGRRGGRQGGFEDLSRTRLLPHPRTAGRGLMVGPTVCTNHAAAPRARQELGGA